MDNILDMTYEERVLFDAADLRPTADGYLVATPRVARTGIQLYRGSEVGRPEMDVVRVFRPEDAVFDKNSMASFAYKPITDDHPPEAVTAQNWKKYSVGQAGGDIARDGEFIRVPMSIMDGAAISNVKSGKVELSVGYNAKLVWGDGVSPKGEPYDAMQKDIRVNHVAIVKRARGGPELKLGDSSIKVNTVGFRYAKSLIAQGKVNATAAWSFSAADGNRLLGPNGDDWSEYGRHHLAIDTSAEPDTKDYYKYPFGKANTVYRRGVIGDKSRAAAEGETAIENAADQLLQLIDSKKDKAMSDEKMTTLDCGGISIQMPDHAAQVVQREMATFKAAIEGLNKDAGVLKAQITTLEQTVADTKKIVETKDAEITTLKQQVKDAALSPEKLDALVRDHATVVAKVKAVLGNEFKTDGLSIEDMRKAVVANKLGEASKDWNADQVKASFDTLTAGIDTSKPVLSGNDQMAALFSRPPVGGDVRSAALAKRDQQMADAWKHPNGAPAQ